MSATDLTSAITAVFIVGMVWLRTRMQYVASAKGQPGRRLQLARAGRVYFGCVIALLIMGWLLAPTAGAVLWPNNGVSSTLSRVVWFLASYYLFILVHRYLRAHGVAVFKKME